MSPGSGAGAASPQNSSSIASTAPGGRVVPLSSRAAMPPVAQVRQNPAAVRVPSFPRQPVPAEQSARATRWAEHTGTLRPHPAIRWMLIRRRFIPGSCSRPEGSSATRSTVSSAGSRGLETRLRTSSHKVARLPSGRPVSRRRALVSFITCGWLLHEGLGLLVPVLL